MYYICTYFLIYILYVYISHYAIEEVLVYILFILLIYIVFSILYIVYTILYVVPDHYKYIYIFMKK